VFTITVTVVVPLSVTGLAVAEQLVPFGRPLQLRVIGWANPPIGEIVRVNCADLPAGTAAEVGVAESVKSDCWPNPVPVRRTTCGLPRALSVSVSAPTLEPAVVGVYVTLITQFVVGCSATFVQLSVSAKSPLAVMLEKVIGTVPSFVAVMGSGLLATPTCC
jgi:hypothetical protein